MRALICKDLTGVDGLTIGELPDPVPGPDDVVIEVRAAGLNFADTLMVAGGYQVQPPLPFSPGFEAAGVVADAGEHAGVELGARVVGFHPSGACAERWLVPSNRVLALPDEVSFEAAAGFGVAYGTALYALEHQGRLRSGEHLLVLGAAGGVGAAAVDIGRALSADVIAAAGSDEKLSFAASLGARAGINYAEEDLKTRIRELTGGDGAAVVFDPVGGPVTEPALRATAWDGRFLVIGFAAGAIPQIPLNLLLLKGIHAIGVFWGAWAERQPAAYRRETARLLDLLATGRLRPPPPTVLDLADHREGYRRLLSRETLGKVVLRVGD